MSIGGQRYYLWRAIDQDGDVIDILLQKRRNAVAAKRFLRKLLKGQQAVPHDTNQYANNRCEAPHRATLEKERQMKRFRTVSTAQRFLVLHGLVRILVNWGRHAMSAATIGISARVRSTHGRRQLTSKIRGRRHCLTPRGVCDKAVHCAVGLDVTLK